jgi:hypothetical protein
MRLVANSARGGENDETTFTDVIDNVQQVGQLPVTY